MTAALVALGAAVGAPLRFAMAQWLDDAFPRGTMLVNVLGSLALGAFVGLSLGDHALALLGVGFCGGLTTYSAFAVQVHELGPRRGASYAALTIVASVAAAAIGFWLTHGWSGHVI